MSAAPCFAERALAAPSPLPGRLVRFEPAPAGEVASVVELCREALQRPIGAPRLEELARGAARIAVIISDASRDEPREEMLTALAEVLPRERITIVVASGTHLASADVVPPAFRDLAVLVNDSGNLEAMTELGVTREGTRVRVLAELAAADLVVVTGRIRPHYFAGYSGGVKGFFPGCGYREDILRNHLLKADPTARLGVVDGNRCRADLEDAAALFRRPLFALNVLSDVDGAPRAAVSGHAVLAHREITAQARPLFTVRVPRARVVIVADRPPVSRSLYQASKVLPPAGAVLEEGGFVILLAECDQGIEPRERVNEGIYQLGVSRSLPARHRVLLVSTLSEDVVRKSYAEYVPDLAAALGVAGVGPEELVPVIFRAGEAIVEAS